MPTRPEFVSYKARICARWCEALGDDGFHRKLLAAFQDDAEVCRVFLNAMNYFDDEFNRRLNDGEDVSVAFNFVHNLVAIRINEHRERKREEITEKMRPDVKIVCAMRALIVLDQRFNVDKRANWTGDTEEIIDAIECNCAAHPQPWYVPAWAHGPAPRI